MSIVVILSGYACGVCLVRRDAEKIAREAGGPWGDRLSSIDSAAVGIVSEDPPESFQAELVIHPA